MGQTQPQELFWMNLATCMAPLRLAASMAMERYSRWTRPPALKQYSTVFQAADGANPNAGLVEDAAGNFYGTTQYGGQACDGRGCGTVFELSTTGQETILYRFRDVPDGASPLGGVALDSSGRVYGTTWSVA
jgi:uncharacterized repeat protein (TIGR03803 family)